VTLGGDDVKQLADAVPAGAAAGPRYPEPQMKRCTSEAVYF